MSTKWKRVHFKVSLRLSLMVGSMDGAEAAWVPTSSAASQVRCGGGGVPNLTVSRLSSGHR